MDNLMDDKVAWIVIATSLDALVSECEQEGAKCCQENNASENSNMPPPPG